MVGESCARSRRTVLPPWTGRAGGGHLRFDLKPGSRRPCHGHDAGILRCRRRRNAGAHARTLSKRRGSPLRGDFRALVSGRRTALRRGHARALRQGPKCLPQERDWPARPPIRRCSRSRPCSRRSSWRWALPPFLSFASAPTLDFSRRHLAPNGSISRLFRPIASASAIAIAIAIPIPVACACGER